jgi:hypothetical protein
VQGALGRHLCLVASLSHSIGRCCAVSLKKLWPDGTVECVNCWTRSVFGISIRRCGRVGTLYAGCPTGLRDSYSRSLLQESGRLVCRHGPAEQITLSPLAPLRDQRFAMRASEQWD